MKIENNMTMKMKLIPEPSCLETQEKFWRGRIKEMNEKFTEERRKMEIMLFRLTTENEQLKSDLDELAAKPSTCSASTQTSLTENETERICKYCQKPLIKTRTIFSKNGGTSHESAKQHEDNSEFFIDNNLVLRENTSFTVGQTCTNGKEEAIDVEKTITKLFTSNGHSNSEKITSKLLELYKKHCTSVPDLVYDETELECSTFHQDKNELIAQDNRDHTQNDTLEKNEKNTSNPGIDSILSESGDEYVKAPKHSKKINRQFLPSVQNIRKKVFRNIFRIKRTCADIKITNNNLKSFKAFNGNSTSELLVDTKRSEENVAKLQTSPKCQLVSAMKKSKSTENIVKKVAFSNDLPSMKTVSESDLLQAIDYRKPQLIGSVQVHRDKFSRPIPAPRSRNNVVVVDP